MNFLIIGGLIVIGVLALVGAIFLGMGEQRTARNNRVEPELPAAPAAAPTITRQLSQPAQSVPTQSVSRPLTETPTLTRPTPSYSVPTEPSFASQEPTRELPTLNGQFHEVVSEIRTLHQQALHLEQRLNILTDMVDRLEHTATSRTGHDEEPYSMHDNTMHG